MAPPRRWTPPGAAELEVEWWRVHRELPHGEATANPTALEPLVAALQAAYAYTYAYTYAVPAYAVRLAAVERAKAMRLSDQWVRGGVDPASRLVARGERRPGSLVRRSGGRIHTDANPPVGALVFYGGGNGYSHVAVSIGGGQAIGTLGDIGAHLPVSQYPVVGYLHNT